MTGTKTRKATKPVVHVVPDNDDRRHRVSADRRCWCRPTCTKMHGGMRVSHNAKDGREFVEVQLGEKLDTNKTWSIVPIAATPSAGGWAGAAE